MSRPGPKIPPLSVTDAQRAVLEGWLRRRTTAQALAQRSRIVLECAEGHSIMEVSRRLRITPDTVRIWRRRFIERGLDGLCDDPRPCCCRKPHPPSSGGMLVLVEDAAESFAFSYVEAGDLLRIGDRHRQRVQRTGVGDALMRPVGVVELFELP